MTTLYPVIMAGGSGTRLWPVSRRALPKQFQPLLSEQTMLAETVSRLDAVEGMEVAAPIIVCGEAHEHHVREIFSAANRPHGPIVLEPEGRNTAPVAIIASSLVAEADPEGLILLLPADHHIADTQAFAAAVKTAAAAASKGYLTTFGIEPTFAETGYGYICRGDQLADETYTVERFVEKPDKPTAESYIADGRYSWNAGIFLYRSDTFLNEAAQHAPDMTKAANAALAGADRDGLRVALDSALFAAVPADSIDYAIMEKTDHAAVIGPVRMGWNDIGSWYAVRDITAKGLEHAGTVVAKDCTNSYLRSDGPLIAAVGLDNIVVVATDDAILIADGDRTQDVKSLIAEIKARKREDLL